MSAYEISYEHINAVLSYAANLPRGNGPTLYIPTETDFLSYRADDDDDASYIGLLMRIANRANLIHLYDDHMINKNDAVTFTFRRDFSRKTDTLAGVVQALKLIRGFEYQCLDRAEYDGSPVANFCDSFTCCLVAQLPGYGAAEWTL